MLNFFGFLSFSGFCLFPSFIFISVPLQSAVNEKHEQEEAFRLVYMWSGRAAAD